MSDISNTFKGYSEAYDLFYRGKDYQAEAEYLISKLFASAINVESILELGSGTAKHASVLVDNGYRITGVELSAEMVARCPTLQGCNFIQGDIRNFNLNATFDCAVSLFHVMSYQVTDEDVVSVFERVKDHLRSGGLFIFDFWFSPAVLAQGVEVRYRVEENDQIKVHRIAVPSQFSENSRVNVNYKLFIESLDDHSITFVDEVHQMRHFTIGELRMFGDRCGFDLVLAEEFLTGQPLSSETWGAAVVFKKR